MTHWLVQSYLDTTCRTFPSNIAVSCGGRHLTYKQLHSHANQLAYCLKGYGVRRQDRVVFCLKRSEDCIVTIFGTLKSDAIYVPLDSHAPASRWEKIIEDCQPSAIICDSTTFSALSKIPVVEKSGIPLIHQHNCTKTQAGLTSTVLDGENLDVQIHDDLHYENIDTDIAYILYTSGSTGHPKGCMISHLNIMNYIDWAINCFCISEADKVLSTAPFHFDMSVFDIYCAMKAAATLCIATEMDLLFPNKLVNLIDRNHITIWKAVSSLLMYLAKTDALEPGRMTTLSRVLFGGEELATKYLIKWMHAYPEKAFYNAYGPTEATGISMYYHVDKIPEDACARIPIGRPCANTEVFLLNEDNQITGINEVGELHLRGSCLSKGYWRDPQKTESEFIPNPVSQIPGDRIYRTRDLATLRKDGIYEYLGRADSQVKYFGYRIELQEIERALLSIEDVNDAAAALCNTELTDIPELAAFVEFKNKPDPSEILIRLKTLLPAYMIPKSIFPMGKIPRTSRGKVDRTALKRFRASALTSPAGPPVK